MSRRFSDEPINLIHRIPTPEQLASARPSKRSFGQTLVEAAATCAQAVAEAIAQVARWGWMAGGTVVGANPDSQGRLEERTSEATTDPLDAAVKASEVVGQPIETAAAPPSQEEANRPQSASVPAVVQPEEVAELRAYLLRQQQDIVRLSAQIQELTSLVVSQQEVLVYLGKELEAGSLSPMMGEIASAAPKRNRPVRRKPIIRDEAAAQKEDPKRSSLGF